MNKLILMLAVTTWLVVGHTTPAWSVWKKGNDLVEDCTSEDPWQEIACANYVIGVADMISAGFTREVYGTFSPICIPTKTVTGRQLQRVVRKYLIAHPEETHNPTVVLVVLALREAFPCQ